MQKISLYDLKSPAIIVKAETGLLYGNQINGVACSHLSQEGFLVPLPDRLRNLPVFTPQWWYDNIPKMNDSLYDTLEFALKGVPFWNVRDIRVDRSESNYEAWVHVTFRGDFDVDGGMFSNGFRHDPHDSPNPEAYPRYKGILTWENCD